MEAHLKYYIEKMPFNAFNTALFDYDEMMDELNAATDLSKEDRLWLINFAIDHFKYNIDQLYIRLAKLEDAEDALWGQTDA